MLANASEGSLLALLIVVLIVFVLVVLCGVVILVWTLVKAKRSGNYNRFKYTLTPVLCVAAAAVSWLTNFGWIRLIMTLMAIPFLHAIAFFLVNIFAASQIEKSRTLKIFTMLSYVTYLCGYLFLPDGGDVGSAYVFFGLLHNDFMIGFGETISVIGLFGNVVFLVLQLIESIKTKRKWNTSNILSPRNEDR